MEKSSVTIAAAAASAEQMRVALSEAHEQALSKLEELHRKKLLETKEKHALEKDRDVKEAIINVTRITTLEEQKKYKERISVKEKEWEEKYVALEGKIIQDFEKKNSERIDDEVNKQVKVKTIEITNRLKREMSNSNISKHKDITIIKKEHAAIIKEYKLRINEERERSEIRMVEIANLKKRLKEQTVQ